jgi:hypothetical protein
MVFALPFSKYNNQEFYMRDDKLIDYDKELNSQCICKIGLPWKGDDVIMLFPCEHLFHKKCASKKKCCPKCNTQIIKTYELLDEDIHPQIFSDILSVSPYDEMSSNTIVNFMDSVFDVTSVLMRILFLKNKEDGKKLCERIFSLNNITLEVFGIEKIREEKNKVLICNHVSHLELIIIYYLFDTGFLASSITKTANFFTSIDKFVPLLVFDRGKKNNTVEEMKNFVEKFGSICLFPEGMMKHPDTLIRFRTGAFHVGYPVYSVAIRHIDVLSNGAVNGFIYKLGGKRDIKLSVYVNGPYYPPFDKEKIEKIRMKMAHSGKMLLSRVTNRDIRDN